MEAKYEIRGERYEVRGTMEPIADAVREFIGDARVCRIATVLPSGEPHVIPVCPVFDGDTTVYVDIGRKYAIASGVNANGRVAVLIDHYDDNWALLKGALLRCRAEVIEGEERDRAWELIRAKFPAYETVGWEPRMTLALRVYDWRQWGILEAPKYETE
jgi:nitroimidazol reductase NimA-like FMN-containing flavoprotein (pyridoxamine 5'-phosphate oxidase superfamily)